MKLNSTLCLRLFIVSIILLCPVVGLTQSTPRPTGVLRLRVRVKTTDTASAKGLARKRFFLVPGTLDQHRALVEAIKQQPIVTRDCYYSKLGASQPLINWLKESDCESIYCRLVEKDFISGPKVVPEFASAFSAGVKDYGSDDTARKWLTTNVPPNLRDGYYRDRQAAIKTFIKQAESSGVNVLSVMTDRNGTAYFTDLEPGTYVLSNLIPTEVGQTLASWTCEVQVKSGDLATEKAYLVSNKSDRNVKCVAVERPLPTCDK
jgi:hypothetical protein